MDSPPRPFINVNTLLQFLALAFAVWAGVVAWGVRQVIGEINSTQTRQDAFYGKFNDYVLVMERRVTMLEDYEKIQDTKRDRIDVELQQLKSNVYSHMQSDAEFHRGTTK